MATAFSIDGGWAAAVAVAAAVESEVREQLQRHREQEPFTVVGEAQTDARPSFESLATAVGADRSLWCDGGGSCSTLRWTNAQAPQHGENVSVPLSLELARSDGAIIAYRASRIAHLA
jgi:hypothetical protein